MKSSSESMLRLSEVVSGVGGLSCVMAGVIEAEAIRLLDRVSRVDTLGVIASAFRFLC